MKYEVLRPLRWRGKELQRGDVVNPRNPEEAQRCGILARSRFLAPIVGDELLKNLQSVGVVVPQRAKPISKAFNDVKQKGEKENGE